MNQIHEFKKFTYSSKPREVFILKEEVDGFSGIELSNLTKDEQNNLRNIVKQLEDFVGTVIKKGYRRFKSSEVVEPKPSIEHLTE